MDIKKQDIEHFFLHLKKESGLSESSLVNVWRGIRVIFIWAEKELGCSRPDLDMPYPKAPVKNVIPFSDSDIRRLISAVFSQKILNRIIRIPLHKYIPPFNHLEIHNQNCIM